MSERDDGAWFAPKRFGYGAGLPIAWQGWALLAGYIAVMLAPTPLLEWDPILGTGIAAAAWIVASALFLWVAKRKTRGGWRWRHGERD
ncbi:MAG: hypothetical protein EVA34_10565 [Erythrobacter sp.]|nr:MAG: hypothetical protein EVA34_10565 [Erythrobacter sp.]